MASFLASDGVLSVSIGGGYLSAFELGTLKPGDVVRSTRQAGYPSTLRLNGFPIAPCEVVVLGGSERYVFGVRVTSADAPQVQDPGPAARDDLLELLPFTVVLGSIRVPLSELRGVSRNTIISLDRVFTLEEDAELQVAGLKVADGKVVVVEEELGIRLTRVSGERFEEQNIRASGHLLGEEDARRVKDYDFRRPDKFSRVAILKLTEIHRFFLRNLAARFPLARGLTLPSAEAGVDQCTFEEAQQLLEKQGELKLLLAENLPRRSGPPTEAARWGAAGKLLLEPGSAHPVAKEVRAWFEQARLEPGYPLRDLVFLYYRPSSPLAEAAERDTNALLACLRGGWKHLVDLNLQAVPAGDPLRNSVRLIHENEMVICVRAAGPDGATAVALLYPYFTLEPILSLLD